MSSFKSQTDSEILGTALDNIKVLKETLRDFSGDQNSRPTLTSNQIQQQLSYEGKVLDKNATKLALVCKPPFKSKELISLIPSMLDSVMKIGNLVFMIDKSTCGRTFLSAVKSASLETIESVERLMVLYKTKVEISNVEQSRGSENGILEHIYQSTSKTFSRCEQLSKLGVNNKDVIVGLWKTTVGGYLGDAIGDLKELLNEIGLLENEEPKNELLKMRIKSALFVLISANVLVEKLYKMISSDNSICFFTGIGSNRNEGMLYPESVEWLDVIYENCKQVPELGDEFAGCLLEEYYIDPPVPEDDEVAEVVERLENTQFFDTEKIILSGNENSAGSRDKNVGLQMSGQKGEVSVRNQKVVG
ncbi:hypothetical protein BB559_003166 [Furculomyces boomerangus]|uniref:Cyclin-D1-binding protein 1-like N-terminal domain-containing protein n=1 Tax=Furculomyces boomerangus TaxID=61424 RepID=A0A2T9YN67_9FUNG|nr:hypothetical protein BB559_003166 [Furculomyces boomerangus]